jgi:hypothetical protein
MVHADGRGRLRAAHLEGDEAWLLFDAGQATLLHGDEQSGLGWFAPVYGTVVPTWRRAAPCDVSTAARASHRRRRPHFRHLPAGLGKLSLGAALPFRCAFCLRRGRTAKV